MTDSTVRRSVGTPADDRWSARFWTAVGLILVAASLRVLPHVPNFSPVTAMALFAGAYLYRSVWAFAVPLVAMLLSDAVIGFHSVMPAVYGAFVLVTMLGFYLRERRGVLRVAGFAVSGSILFFVITNFAVWAQGTMYPMTPAGFVECYVAALPFLQSSLVGDLCYTGALFGAWVLLEKNVPSLRRA